MIRFVFILAATAMLSAIPLAAETVNGILVDNMCSTGIVKKGYEAAKMHTKECALMDQCKASGYGVVQADGKYLKLDAAGNEQAVKALEGTSKEKDITVTVDGEVSGDAIKVSKLKIS